MKKLLFLFCALVAIESTMAQKTAEIQILGHRGGRFEVDENTLAGFKDAYSKGVRAFETDIRMTADGELVIMHDASLKRIANVDLVVEESSRKELKKLKTKKGNPILFADELADFFRKSEVTYIEWEMKTKNYPEEKLATYCKKLYKLVMKQKPANAAYIFSSFDTRVIKVMKELHPDAECMMITSKPMSKAVRNAAKELGVRRIACSVKTSSHRNIAQAKKEGFIINLWPGGSIEQFMLALALGADIACLDCPVEVIEFIKEKLPWVTPSKDLR
ncbi:MAG: glycerophosphodiester phosphodiesterase [Rikenellaceae bacterium]|nr:glycerophosphodiester phosphodiesterase [Rikenellaceae bacterium]